MSKYTAIGPAVLLALWLGVTELALVDPLLLPRPLDVAKELYVLFASRGILVDIGSTAARWLSGLAIGASLGIPLGLLMGSSGRVYASLEVVVDFFRSIPVMAMFPLFMVFYGIGDRSKIAISAWTTVFYVVINTLYGVKHGNRLRRMVARVFRASPWQTFWKVVLPEALPHIFVGMRLSVSMSLVLVVASEMVMGTTTGLGKRIFDSGITYNMSEMYSTIILSGLLGYLSNKVFVIAEARLLHWAAK